MKARVATAERAQRSAFASPSAASTAGGRPPSHAAASAGAHLHARPQHAQPGCDAAVATRQLRGAPLAQVAHGGDLIGDSGGERRGAQRGAQLVGPPQRVGVVHRQRVQVRRPERGGAWRNGGKRQRKRGAAGGAARRTQRALRRHAQAQQRPVGGALLLELRQCGRQRARRAAASSAAAGAQQQRRRQLQERLRSGEASSARESRQRCTRNVAPRAPPRRCRAPARGRAAASCPATRRRLAPRTATPPRWRHRRRRPCYFQGVRRKPLVIKQRCRACC